MAPIKRNHGRRRAGFNPFAYVGVEHISPFGFYVYEESPTVDDYVKFNVGDVWFREIEVANEWTVTEVWILVRKLDDVATWIELGLVPFSATSFPTDAGTAVQVGGVVNLIGSGVIETTGSGNTVTIGIPGGLDGQTLIGGGANAAWADITSTGATVTITQGSNSINLEVTGGGTGVTSLEADVGDATPDGTNTIFITGDANLNTTAAGAVLTINLNDSISILGPLTLSLLGTGVMQTDAAGLVTSDSGLDGEVLIGGGAAPAWDTITSTGGTVAMTDGPNSIDLAYSGGGGGSVSSFLAYQDGDANNVTGDRNGGPATVYTLGTARAFATIFDTGTDISVGGGGAPVIFTAPQTGKYLLSLQVYNEHDGVYPVSINKRITYKRYISIITTARSYITDEFLDVQTYPQVDKYEKESQFMSAVADMTVGDTATFTVWLNVVDAHRPGTKVENIVGGTALSMQTWISGFLLS